MRLIDVDNVISVAEGEFSEEDVSKIRWLISHIGTAYDVDKVVKELEQRKVFHKKLANYESVNGTRTEMNQHLKAIEVLDKSIEIVKQQL